jgi:hypothetical protein
MILSIIEKKSKDSPQKVGAADALAPGDRVRAEQAAAAALLAAQWAADADPRLDLLTAALQVIEAGCWSAYDDVTAPTASTGPGSCSPTGS